ncbi:MAG: prephenate dehydratase [Megasphaera sp.]|nr:prephenate dehydratase [Megasphaera sp.]
MAEDGYMVPVACFGTPGSYSYKAMTEFFAGKQLDATYYSQFEDLVQTVASGSVRYGVLPIENSSTGGITEVYDLIHRYDCSIVGEKYIKVEHHLMALPGTELEDITTVYSHPQGLAQCRDFLKHHENWHLHPYYSTSQSAKRVEEMQRHDMAAIANETSAELYHLRIIAPCINDNTTNFTRFFIIAPHLEEKGKHDKITLVLTVRHEPGALYHVLGYFFYNGMNMTHLESRPIKGKPFEYFFHIDVMGDLRDTGIARALTDLSKHCKYFKILGNYPADSGGIADEIRTDRR